jgi:flagellar motor switch protein FliG
MPPALRKAAILITALDTPTADALLAQMEPGQAQIVRSAVLSLGEVSPREQQQVLEEFFRQQGRSEASGASAAVTLELSPSVDPPAAPPAAASQRPEIPPPASDFAARGAARVDDGEEPPLAFLNEVDPSALAEVLRNEHPQTSAVVLAHLSPAHAATVLQQLPPELAIEALTRMAWLAPLAREVLLDLAQVLWRLLAPHRTSAAALEKLSAVLAAMDQAPREQVLAQLSRRHRSLARRLEQTSASARPSSEWPAGGAAQSEPAVASFRYRLQRPALAVDPANLAQASVPSASQAAFDPASQPAEDLDPLRELAALDDRSLKRVLTRLDVPTLALALPGAEAGFVARVLRLLPPDEARWLRAELAQARPARLRDIEQALRRCRAALRAAEFAEGQPGEATPPRARSPAASSHPA